MTNWLALNLSALLVLMIRQPSILKKLVNKGSQAFRLARLSSFFAKKLDKHNA
jgi:hypothetical protein